MRRLLLILPLVLSQTLAAQSPRNLEGVWNFATLTPFERPAEFGAAEFFTDTQAAAFEALTIGRNDRDRRDGGAATDAARGVADYWFDRGEHVASLNGKKRASWVIDPPDGKVPPLTAEARARLTARNLDARDHPADGPENRSLQERCLAFNAGPPIGLGPYNNFVQIFQTRDAVVIFTEMIHDARIVWTDGRPHAPQQKRIVALDVFVPEEARIGLHVATQLQREIFVCAAHRETACSQAE